MQIAESDVIGVVCRGGPVNGPYAAGALAGLKSGLAERGLRIANLYGNSASVPAAVMAAISKEEKCCDVWAKLRPSDIIAKHSGWLGKAIAVRNILFRPAVFDSTPLKKLLEKHAPLKEVFAPEALPVKIMTVDYLTGRPITFSNKNSKHRPNWFAGMKGSMTLVPFFEPTIAYEVADDELLPEPYLTVGDRSNCAVLIDGGYSDNLMFDAACRDGNTFVFVVDINGLELGPLETPDHEKHWAYILQRAFHVLITTNDRRRLTGVERTNEILAIRDELVKLSLRSDLPEEVGRIVDSLVDRMNYGWLKLHNKHAVQIAHVADRECSRSFDFSNFTTDEVVHLIHCGQQAARKVLAQLEVV